jgi:hypothetical protein
MLNPVTWMVWAASAGCVALLARNPFYLCWSPRQAWLRWQPPPAAYGRYTWLFLD